MAARLSQIRTAALAVCVCGFTLHRIARGGIVSGTFSPFDGTWRFAGVVHPVTQGWNCGLLAIASLHSRELCREAEADLFSWPWSLSCS